MKELTFSLVGYGNVGSWAGRLLSRDGAKMKAVLDHTGAIRRDEGLDANALARYVERSGGVAGFPAAEAVSAEEFYTTPVDAFIPAALEQMIDEKIAGQLDCKVLVEAANLPMTPDGEVVIQSRGVEVLPAILCNAGGVTVSYFEWKQNRQAETWDLEVVDEQLNTYIVRAARRTKLAADRFKCDLRTASYIAALEHIGRVYNLRGIFP